MCTKLPKAGEIVHIMNFCYPCLLSWNTIQPISRMPRRVSVSSMPNRNMCQKATIISVSITRMITFDLIVIN